MTTEVAMVVVNSTHILTGLKTGAGVTYRSVGVTEGTGGAGH